ncbi:MAG TPA: hypothetical protein VHM19_09870 [Polyangiales bacterium]|nr:hypothetical protein [Polyangiales bacterium]
MGLAVVAGLLTAAVGCSDRGAPGKGDGGSGGKAGSERDAQADAQLPEITPTPTYYGDVEPILRGNCVGCHRPDGVAPFALTTFDAAAENALPIAGVTQEHRMPPWPAVSSGDCPTLVGSRRLDDHAIAVLGSWARGGAPEGKAPAMLPALPPAYGALKHVDAVLQSQTAYQPMPEKDDYRCFVVDPKLDAGDRYLAAYAVRLDAPGVVHHVQLWTIETDDSEAQLDALEAADPEPGYECLGDIGVPGTFVSVWAPSDPVRRHPEGTGVLLHGGHRMVIQIHYHDHTGQSRADRSSVELELVKSVEHPARLWALAPPDINLAPGEKSVKVQGSLTVGTTAQRVWGVRAHMHTLGSSEHVSLSVKGKDRCLLDIPRWDPSWQMMYFYDQPLELPAGSQLNVTCEYDTRNVSQPVRYGPRSEDEMCFAYFYVTD